MLPLVACLAVLVVVDGVASPARAAAPAARAYELVSPADKLGNDVIAESSRTRAAAAEAPGLPMAVTFASLGGFADVRGTGISVEYLAQRTGAPGTSGWTTHAITPAQDPLTVRAAAQNLDPAYEGDMAADLTRGVFRAWSPLTGAPNVAGVENLYVREDLRRPGAGLFRLLTDASAPLAPLAGSAAGGQRPYLAAAAADFEQVLFESRLNLTPGATGGNVKLYKADGAHVTLLAPGGATCPAIGGAGAAAPCSAAGLGAAALRRTPRTLSADGTRALVTAPVTLFGSVSTSGAAPSSLYQADDRGTPATGDDVVLKVNASEKDPPDAPAPAQLEAASADGDVVFLTSTEQLTETAGAGLYRWTRQPGTGGRRLTLVGPGATAALGGSEDGRHVYFVAPGQLLAGGPAVSENGLYHWEDDGAPGGTLSFVGGISLADAGANLNVDRWNLTAPVARVTPDGRTLLFAVSDGQGLAPRRDHGSCPDNPNETSNGRCSQLYVYRADRSAPLAPDLACVSCPPSGAAATANAYVNVRDGAGASQLTWHASRALSDDGRRVFFSTAQALADGDANGRVDVYEHDVPGGRVRLLSSAGDTDDAWFLDASASGDDVFFLTRERLVGWDADQAYDLYDARAGGGFPEPPAPPAPCSGEACRGLPRAPPPPATLGSVAVRADDERRARRRPRRRARGGKRAKRCKRGFVRRKVRTRRGRVKRRCVRRAHARARARRGARARGRGAR